MREQGVRYRPVFLFEKFLEKFKKFVCFFDELCYTSPMGH